MYFGVNKSCIIVELLRLWHWIKSNTILGEHFIENGCQWVHGEEGNKIFEIASSMKLLDVEECSQLKVSYIQSKNTFWLVLFFNTYYALIVFIVWIRLCFRYQHGQYPEKRRPWQSCTCLGKNFGWPGREWGRGTSRKLGSWKIPGTNF